MTGKMTSWMIFFLSLFCLSGFSLPIIAQGIQLPAGTDHAFRKENASIIFYNASNREADTIAYQRTGQANQQYQQITDSIHQARFDSLIGSRLKLEGVFKADSTNYSQLAGQSEGWKHTIVPMALGVDIETSLNEQQNIWRTNQLSLRDYLLNLLIFGINTHGEQLVAIDQLGRMEYHVSSEVSNKPAAIDAGTTTVGGGEQVDVQLKKTPTTSERSLNFGDSITWLLLGLLLLAILTPILLHFLRQRQTQKAADKKQYKKAIEHLVTNLYQYLSGPLNPEDQAKLEANLGELTESHKLGFLRDLRQKYLAKLHENTDEQNPIFTPPNTSQDTNKKTPSTDLIALDILHYLKEETAAPEALSEELKQQLDGLKASWKLGHHEAPPPTMIEKVLTEEEQSNIEKGQQVTAFQEAMKEVPTDQLDEVVYTIQALKCMDQLDQKEYDKLIQRVVANDLLNDALKQLMEGEKTPEELDSYLKNRSIQLYGKPLQYPLIDQLQRIMVKSNIAEDNQLYLQQLLQRYQPFFNQIEAMELPLQKEQQAWFFTHLFELAFHFYYFAQVSKIGSKNVLPFAYWNYELVKQNRMVSDLQTDKIKQYDKHIAHRLVHVIHALASSVGISQLDRILIDGYHFDKQAFDSD